MFIFSILVGSVVAVNAESRFISYPIQTNTELLQYNVSEKMELNEVMKDQKDINLQDLGLGVLNKKRDLYYYTTKDHNSWGANKFINVYSLKEKRIIQRIPFDNTGYYKYPISISPDNKKIVLAERAQSVGEVNILVIDSDTGNTLTIFTKAYAPTAVWLDSDSVVTMFPRVSCSSNRYCDLDGINLKLSNLKIKEDRQLEVSGNEVSLQLDHLELISDKINIRSKLREDSEHESRLQLNVKLLKNE